MRFRRGVAGHSLLCGSACLHCRSRPPSRRGARIETKACARCSRSEPAVPRPITGARIETPKGKKRGVLGEGVGPPSTGGARIETEGGRSRRQDVRPSPPSRGRGSKRRRAQGPSSRPSRSPPSTGARIERQAGPASIPRRRRVAPITGARIETLRREMREAAAPRRPHHGGADRNSAATKSGPSRRRPASPPSTGARIENRLKAPEAEAQAPGSPPSRGPDRNLLGDPGRRPRPRGSPPSRGARIENLTCGNGRRRLVASPSITGAADSKRPDLSTTARECPGRPPITGARIENPSSRGGPGSLR